MSGSDRNLSMMYKFQLALDLCDLTYLSYLGAHFTWNNNRDAA